MVNLLCSPPGSGKSKYIYNEIKKELAEDKNVILIVPEQEAVIAETALTRLLDGENSMRLEVLNFKRLCNRVFREYGGLCYNYINVGGQTVILWRVLSELSGTLTEIGIPAEVDEALTARLLALYKSFKSCRISAEMLENAGAALSGKIARKTQEIAAVFARYKEILGKDYDDACEDLDRLYDTLCTYDFFAGKSVYFDSFYDFTAQELSVITEIVRQAEKCLFSIEYDTCEGAVNYLRPQKMKNDLCKVCREQGKEAKIITGTSGRRNADIAYAADKIWDYDAPAFTGECEIELLSCNGKYEEAQIASAKAASLVRTGIRYREIAVISRSMSDYEGIIDVALRAKGIPCHISQRNRLALHPAVRAVFGALDIISHNWQSGDVIAYLKTGLTPLSADEVNSVAAYIRLWNIKGKKRYVDAVWNMNPDEHTADFAPDAHRRLGELNALKDRFTAPLDALSDSISSAESPADTAQAIYELMLALGLNDRLNNYDGHLVWDTLCEALEQYADCAELCRDSANVSRVLHMIVASSDIGNIPSHADEVTCGSADMIRLSGIKHVIVMGVNDGGFPRRIKDDSFFTEYELKMLSQNGIELPDGIDMRADDERFFFMKSLSFASQGITLTYCDEKKSEGAQRICALFGIEAKDASSIGIFEKIYSLSDACVAAGMATDPLIKDALGRICETETGAEVCETQISKANIELLYPGDMSLTQSRIESFNECPFKFRCVYDLGISEKTGAKLLPTEKGTFIHAIFENTLRRAFCGDRIVSSQAEMESMAAEEAKKYVDKVCAGTLASARIYAVFEDLTRTAVTLAGSMYREFSASSFRPAAFEAGIGTGKVDIIEPFYIPVDDDGRRAMIYGKIDRVDMIRSGEDAYLRIIDYKSGSDEFTGNDIAHRKNLQMPLYLLSLMKNENPLFRESIGVKGKIIPAGFMYYRVGDAGAKVSAEDVGDFSDERYIDKYIARSGVYLDEPPISDDAEASIPGRKKLIPKSREEIAEYEATVGEAVRQVAQGILSGDCSLSLNPRESYCNYCQYRAICRRKEKGDE